jgi:hypothetical protein
MAQVHITAVATTLPDEQRRDKHVIGTEKYETKFNKW